MSLYNYSNWSNNVLNLVTKRSHVFVGHMEWIDGNIGSSINMKYPSCIYGEYAKGTTISIAFAGKNTWQDAAQE